MADPLAFVDYRAPNSNPPHPPMPPKDEGAIARFFGFARHGTDLRTEVLAGLTTFMTLAYILVVNPIILGDAIFLDSAGDLFPELMVATAISGAIGTLTMILVANYPFCLAPGMGIKTLPELV